MMRDKVVKLLSMFFVCMILLSGSVIAGEEEEILKDTKDNPSAGLSLALSSKNESIALGAFGAFLKGTDLTKPESISGLSKFAGKGDSYFFKTVLLISLQQEAKDIAFKLIETGGERNIALGVGVLASIGLGDSLVADRNALLDEFQLDFPVPGTSQAVAQFIEEGGDADGKAKKKGKTRGLKGKKGKKNVGKSSSVTIPSSVFSSESERVVIMAILSAAYLNDTEAASSIDAVVSESAEVQGAKLLYYAKTGKALPADMLEKVMNAGVNKPIPREVVGLSRYNLLLPGAAYACEAIGATGDSQYVPYLKKGLKMGDVRVQVEAAKALRKISATESLLALQEAVVNCEWSVLVEVCEALSRMPDKKSIPVLIERLKKEKGRFRLDLTRTLSVITGGQGGRRVVEDWEKWWKASASSFSVDAAASESFRIKTRVQDISIPSLGNFYGLPIFSDSFAYVVDSSKSMKDDRITDLKINLMLSLKTLKPIASFNIVDFGGDIEVMYPSSLTKDKFKAQARIKKMDLSGGTRSFDAMERSFWLSGLDSIYFLSDGAPVRGQEDNWKYIMRGFMLINRHRQVAIFALDFDPKAGNSESMQRMAAENYGLHSECQVTAVKGDFEEQFGVPAEPGKRGNKGAKKKK